MRTNWLVLLTALASIGVACAQSSDSPFDPYFVGWGTEPTMDAGGRDIISIDRGIGRAFGTMSVAKRKPGVAAAWEFPVALLLDIVHHEFDGHGGRAREFHLGPSYGFGFDVSAYTSIERAPATHEQGIYLSAAGVESGTVLAQRLQLDLLRPDGAEAWTVPLLIITKLDLAHYVALTSGPSRPNPGETDEFLKQYREGNDMASWIVGRHAARTGQDVTAVWNGDATIDYDDPLIEKNWRAAQVAAVWSVLDPALVSTTIAYFRHHLSGGELRVHAPVLRLGEGTGLTVGTRGALGPGEVSRFLDVYVTLPRAVVRGYVRDLDSSVERTWGGGVALHGLRLGRVQLGVLGDWWTEPHSLETLAERGEGRCWNVAASVDAMVTRNAGLAISGGRKSAGFLPGAPASDGTYLQVGALVAF